MKPRCSNAFQTVLDGSFTTDILRLTMLHMNAIDETTPISRRLFLGATSASVAALATQAHAAAPPSRPNVLYVFGDEHRWQSMHHTELPQVHTPTMDRMARKGFEFNRCISNYPVCSPYRAMVMSGRWPYEQGVIDNNIPLSPDEMTLGKAFHESGYRTGYIGKWHLGGTRAEPYGFDTSLIWTGDGNHEEATCHPDGTDPVVHHGYTVDEKTDQAIAFMKDESKKPFFLMLSYNAPHSHFTDAPDDLKALYPPGSIPWRPNVDRAKSDNRVSAFRFSEADYLGYHAHITGVDRALGRILATLDDLGIADNTLVIYTSDHGSMFGSHGVGSKRQPYEESIRVPFICRGPVVAKPGSKTDALFGTIDIMPTVCALAGIPVPTTCRGQDFSPWLRGQSGPDPESQFIMHISKLNASSGIHHPAPIFRGVRTKRYTYAILEDRPNLLFDDTDDHYQMHNRYNDPALHDVQQSCDAMLESWLHKAHDPFSLKANEQG